MQAPVNAVNAVAAIVEVAIGVALLTRRAIKPVLLVSFARALGIWFAVEGLGGIFTSSAPNAFTGVIGTAPLYIVAGLIVWPREQRPGQTTKATGLLGQRGARAVWVVLWTAAAVSWLLPSNDGSGALHDLFSGAPSGSG